MKTQTIRPLSVIRSVIFCGALLVATFGARAGNTFNADFFTLTNASGVPSGSLTVVSNNTAMVASNSAALPVPQNVPVVLGIAVHTSGTGTSNFTTNFRYILPDTTNYLSGTQLAWTFALTAGQPVTNYIILSPTNFTGIYGLLPYSFQTPQLTNVVVDWLEIGAAH